MSTRTSLCASLPLLACLVSGPAVAETPAKKQATLEEKAKLPDANRNLEMLDESELVMAAAKRVSTISEAPLIVYVLSADEIQQQGYMILNEAVGRVPGFIPYGFVYSVAPTAVAHGVNWGTLLLYDGVSLRDTSVNYQASLNWTMPVEMIRRIEVSTSPGGVLWGANSFVGLVSLTPKTADDLDGVEAGGGYGTGPGSPHRYRGYVMGGHKFLKGKIKGLLHVSWDSWRGPERDMVNNIILPPPPLPRGPMLYGPAAPTVARRSNFAIIDGNVQAGPFFAGWHVPIGEMHHGYGFNGSVIPDSLGERQLGCTSVSNDCVDPQGLMGMHINFFDRFGYLGYQNDFWQNRVNLVVRASYFNAVRTFERYAAVPASSTVPGGMDYYQNYDGHRAALTADTGIRFSASQRLLVGAEAAYEVMPEHPGYFSTYEQNTALIPFPCAPTQDGKLCPGLSNYHADRITGAGFINHQMTFSRLALEAGVRLEGAGGKRGFGATPLLSGAAVYQFYPGWFAKVNYAEGFRSPQFQQTDSSGQTIAWAANPSLEVERSRSVLGQVIAEVARDTKSIKLLRLSLGYSYSWVTNFIHLEKTAYTNSEDIGVHAVELSGRLNLTGGHWASLGYTFLGMVDAGRGAFRGVPAQWATLTGYLNLLGDYLGLSTNLMVVGSSEDPNRWIHLDSGTMFLGRVEVQNGKVVPVADRMLASRGSDVLLDRVPPAAIWNVGVGSFFLKRKLHLRADVYNLLNARYYYPDIEFDRTSGIETVPNLAPGVSFFVSAAYRH